MAYKNRSVGALVVGVLNLVIGLPCLGCTGWRTAQQLAAKPDVNQPQPIVNLSPKDPVFQSQAAFMEWEAAMPKEVASMQTKEMIVDLFEIIASAILAISGVLLLLTKPIGRRVCILGAVLLLMSPVADFAYQMIVVLPAARTFDQKFEQRAREKGHASPAVSVSTVWTVANVFTLLIRMAYPVTALLVMRSAGVRRVYTSAAADGSGAEFTPLDG